MRSHWIGLLCALAAAGCGGSFVLDMPDVVPDLWKPGPRSAEPLRPLDCQFMSVLIDYSRHGDVRVAVKVAESMADEFESLGTRVTSTRDDAFWSLMILASENARRDGYIFSAMLSARNMNEGYDPGVTVFRRDGEAESEGESEGDSGKIPTMYHGLSYGPHDAIEDQSRLFVRQAYAAVFPYAEQLCELEASDRERERSLDEQLPGSPEPL